MQHIFGRLCIHLMCQALSIASFSMFQGKHAKYFNSAVHHIIQLLNCYETNTTVKGVKTLSLYIYLIYFDEPVGRCHSCHLLFQAEIASRQHGRKVSVFHHVGKTQQTCFYTDERGLHLCWNDLLLFQIRQFRKFHLN